MEPLGYAGRTGTPFTVFYIANGHAVSHQNKARVVDFLGGDAFKAAIATPDRLSLMAISARPSTNVLVYALTPATSFPGAKTRLSGGRKEERAVLKVLLEAAYPSVSGWLDPDVLRLRAGRGAWADELEQAEGRFAVLPSGLISRLRQALASEFGEFGPVMPAALQHAALGNQSRDALKPGTLVGRLRRALALATLRHRPPDLIIFDEFQRYRDLLNAEEDLLVKALLRPDDAKPPPRVLLLSATPYHLLTTRWQEAQGALAQEDLLRLIAFLAGQETADQAKTLFCAFGDKLRELSVSDALKHPETPARLAQAADLRDRLRALLTPMMSRTERDCVSTADPLAGTRFLDASATEEDFRVYRHLVEIFQSDARHEALPYWSSIPLPAQSMGPRYLAWKRAAKRPMKGLVTITKDKRARLRPPSTWPDAKLRALSAVVHPDLLSLPWVAPSLPWWPLAGGWKRAADAAAPAADQAHRQGGGPTIALADPKTLLFSRFRATPPSVAALLSFGVEARFLAKEGSYDQVYRRRRFKLTATPGPVMAAFHPSPWFIQHTDPLAAAGRSLAEVRRAVRSQILKALPHILDRSTAKARQRHRPTWKIIAAIEKRAGFSDQVAAGWSRAAGTERPAQVPIRKWRNVRAIESLSPIELEDLVDYALGAPGVVLGRALLRHDPRILAPGRYPELVHLSWQGVRSYLDNPVLLAAMKGGDAVSRILRATVEGGLESVLDEHFWLRAQNLPGGAATLAGDLLASLGLRTGSFSFHGLGHEQPKIPVRCHVAVPFSDAEPDGAIAMGGGVPLSPVRPDEVRRSFNAPFWPHVLATTSVGQEGLDFHPWCSHIVHWDLSSNPLDLEQREGRLQRYAGLAVRRRLAAMLQSEIFADAAGKTRSPWQRVQERAEQLADASGLRPRWVLDGAEIVRHIFRRPFGRDGARFAQLREQRMIYRLALGQPNQEDFIDVLSRGGEAVQRLLRPLILDLSAMGLRKPGEPEVRLTGKPPPIEPVAPILQSEIVASVPRPPGDPKERPASALPVDLRSDDL